MDYLGSVNRFTKQKSKEIVNKSFLEYLQRRRLQPPIGYRMVFSNLDASFKSVSKYDKSQPALDDGAWCLAGEWTKQHFHASMCGSRILSEIVVLSEMDMSTSCGYPASLEFHTKKEMLGLSSEMSVIDSYDCGPKTKAAMILTDFWDLIGGVNENNIVPIWTCSQKVEMRAVEKLRQNKVRTFTAAPIEHSVATNRLCLDMNNKFYASANRTWSFVGATKYLRGWDNLYRRLNKHPNAFDLDESEYDSSIFEKALRGQEEIRWEFLSSEYQTPDNRNRMAAIYDSIIHSVIVLENGELVQKHTGNPSGSSNTIVDNTMILYRLFAYAWILLCNENQRRPLYNEFTEHVEAALNGDDNTFTVSDEMVIWFHPKAIARVWSKIGVTTNTSHDEPRMLHEVSFLSNGFEYDKSLGLWLPVPEYQRIVSSLAYGSQIDDIRFHLLRANALRLDSYGNKEVRQLLRGYIEFVLQVYSRELVGEVQLHGSSIPMNEILELWKSDSYIEALYSGNEAVASASTLHCFKTIQLLEVKQSLKSSYTLTSTMPTKKKGIKKKAIKRVVRALVTRPSPEKKKKKGMSGESLGKEVGRYLGGGLKKLGSTAGKWFGSITGMGDYKIRQNSLKLGPPSFGGGSVTIRHREYITDVVGSTGFTSNTFGINPGNAALMPWGSTVAQNFAEYDVRGMVFEYRSTSSASVVSTGGNAALGTVIMATQYNNEQATFVTKRDMENTEFACSASPAVSFLHPVECARNSTISDNLFVRMVDDEPTDINLYDHGKFTIATVGQQSGVGVIGELWVSYDIVMNKPRLTAGTLVKTAHFRCTGVTTTPASVYAKWCGLTVATAYNNMGAGLVYSASTLGGRVSFGSSGTYLLYINANYSSTVGGANDVLYFPSLAYSTGVTFRGVWFDGTGAGNNGVASSVGAANGFIGTTAALKVCSKIVVVDVSNPLTDYVDIPPVTCTSGQTVGVGLFTDVVITSLSGNISMTTPVTLESLMAEVAKLKLQVEKVEDCESDLDYVEPPVSPTPSITHRLRAKASPVC